MACLPLRLLLREAWDAERASFRSLFGGMDRLEKGGTKFCVDEVDVVSVFEARACSDGGPAAIVFEVGPDGFGRRLGGEDPNWYEDGKEAGRGVLVRVAKCLMEGETCPMT